MSLDDLLRFVIKPLQVAFGRLIGCLRRFYRDSCTFYLLLPAAKLGCLVFMLSYPESLGGVTFLLTRAQSFRHGRIHLRLQVAHARRNGTRQVSARGGDNTLRTVASPLKELAAGFYLAASKFWSKLAGA